MATRMIGGTLRLQSPWFSNAWDVLDDTEERLARLVRHPRDHSASAVLRDGTRWRLVPDGFGVVRLLEEGSELGRIVRRSWWGRRWEVVSPTWGYELVSDPLPRRWHLRVGHEPIARLAGSPISYNRLTVETDLVVPLQAVVLAWHVIARPWEAAARPAGLVPLSIEPRSAPAAGAA